MVWTHCQVGYFTHELQILLQIRVHAPLLKLTASGHLWRERLARAYLCPKVWKPQLNRQKQNLKVAASGDRPIIFCVGTKAKLFRATGYVRYLRFR